VQSGLPLHSCFLYYCCCCCVWHRTLRNHPHSAYAGPSTTCSSSTVAASFTFYWLLLFVSQQLKMHFELK